MATMTVGYKLCETFELDDKFNKSQDSMDFAEQEDYLTEIIDTLQEMLPEGADINYIYNNSTNETLLESE